MATCNAVDSTNNINQVLWSYSTRLAFHTDRPAGSVALHGLVLSVDNLGVGVAECDLFTLLS